MDNASRSISAIDLTVMDHQAVTDMRQQVTASQQSLDAALALIDSAPPSRSPDDQRYRENTRSVVVGFSEYNKALKSLADLLEHVIPLVNLDTTKTNAARRSIADADPHVDEMVRHLDAGSRSLNSVDPQSLPPSIREATEELCQKYAGKKTISETVTRFDAIRHFEYLMLSLDYFLSGLDYFQQGDYRMAEQKFLTARGYMIVVEAHGGTDFEEDVREMQESVDDLLSKRIFTSVSGQIEPVYITDPLNPANQILLRDAITRAGH